MTDQQRARAACLDTDPDLFFDPDRRHQAAAICNGCPILEPCADEADAEGHHGTWGGRWRRGRTPPAPTQLRTLTCAACGTSFQAKRSDARYCGARRRAAQHRAAAA